MNQDSQKAVLLSELPRMARKRYIRGCRMGPRFDRQKSSRGHQPGSPEPFHARSVRRGPDALLLSWGEDLPVENIIDGIDPAVDPSEAERLFNGLVISE